MRAHVRRPEILKMHARLLERTSGRFVTRMHTCMYCLLVHVTTSIKCGQTCHMWRKNRFTSIYFVFPNFQRVISFKPRVRIQIRLHRWISRDEIFDSRSHMDMFWWNFFDANFRAIWCNFSTVLCNFSITLCNFFQNQFLDLHDSTFMRLQCSNHDNFNVQLVYYPDQLSSSRCATLLPTRGCVVFHCRCTLLPPPLQAICAT